MGRVESLPALYPPATIEQVEYLSGGMAGGAFFFAGGQGGFDFTLSALRR